MESSNRNSVIQNAMDANMKGFSHSFLFCPHACNWLKPSRIPDTRLCSYKADSNKRQIHCQKSGIKWDFKILVQCLDNLQTFSMQNIEAFASMISGSHLIKVTKHTVHIYKGLNFCLHKRTIRKLRKHKNIYKTDLVLLTNPNLFVYKDENNDLFVVEQGNALFKHINKNPSGPFTEARIYFDIHNNSFVRAEKLPVNLKRSCNDVKSPRPISLDPTGTKRLENRLNAHALYYVAPVSGHDQSMSMIAQCSEDVAERRSSQQNSGRSYRRDLETDQYSFYQRTIRPFSATLGEGDGYMYGSGRHTRAAYRNYTGKEDRRRSFCSNWPHPSDVQDVEVMAFYGFFFTGNADLVRCFLCGIGLKDWGEADDPLIEHVRYSPDCQFLVDVVPPTRLRQLKASFLENVVSSQGSAGSRTSQTADGRSQTSNDDIFLPVQPRNPQYRLKEVRISSFSKWPRDITQTAEELAEAGFFYAGCGDIVRCYVCDGGLQKWSPEDNAWVEHARWFPNCAYVRQIKGSDFIELVKLSTEQDQLDEGASEGATGNANAYENDLATGITRLNVSGKGDQNNIKLQAIKKSVREVTGCSEARVTKAIEIMQSAGQDIDENSVANYLMDTTSSMVNENYFRNDFDNEHKSVEELEAETEQLRSIVKCSQCKDNDADSLFLPCAHLRFCESCSVDMLVCPYCKKRINYKVKTFMS